MGDYIELPINEGDPRGRSIFVEQCGSAKMFKFVYSEVEPGSLAKIERKKTISVHHSKQNIGANICPPVLPGRGI